MEFSAENSEVNVESADFSGYFAWDNFVEADGVIRPVNSSVVTSEYGSRIEIVYPRAAQIIHDPTLGLAFDFLFPPTLLDILQDAGVFLLGGSAIIVLIVTLGIFIVRPRIRNSH